MPPCHVFAYNGANTRTSVLKKNLTFPNYELGKGQYAFYHMKLSRFSKKIKLVRNTEISYGRALTLQTGSNASLPTKHFKSQKYFLRVLDILTS